MPQSSLLRASFLLSASVAVLLFVAGACRSPVPQAAGLPEVVDFNFHVKPILSDRCFKCHGPDDRTREASLRLDTREGLFGKGESGRRAVVPGSVRRSELVRRVTSSDPAYAMPPVSSHLSLSEYEKALLAKWVEQGADWKPHWSLLAPEPPSRPAVRNAAWPRQEIDYFVLAALEARDWQPAPEASRVTWLRRVTFDLTGLPPTIPEIDAFLADRTPEAYERVVDRLLASEAYGERMASDWMDLARYADSHGYQDDGMRNVWPWRDWVIRAFNENMPYDRFVTWQLAGDLLPEPTQDQQLATAFNRNHAQSQEGGIIEEEYRTEYVADRVNTLGRAFLGLTLECARCHDHKYDPISQREYFEVYAFFNNINESGQVPYAGEASPTVILTDDAARRQIEALRAQIAPLEARIDPAHPDYDMGFDAWLHRLSTGSASGALRWDGLQAHYPLDEMGADKTFANRVNPSKPAVLDGDQDRVPQTVEGRFGKAQRLVGESAIDVGADVGVFERNEPFSISLWLRLEKDSLEGPVFSRSGGLFNGRRSYDGFLNRDGTLTAGLHHNWPDNSIEVRTLDAVPSGAWHHLAFTYDGSSRAAGLRFYLDGRPMRTRVLTDHLRRSILHRGDGANHGGISNLHLGRRFDETPADVAFDELKVFARRLTAVEVSALAGAADPLGDLVKMPPERRTKAQQDALREHYVVRVAPSYRQAFTELTTLRGRENEVLSALPEVMVMRERLEPRPTFLLKRGAYDAPGEPVGHGTPAAVMPFPEHLPKNRLGLAQWLFDPKHPLTARVAVNRLWQQCFGRGLVFTSDDFGSQGALPTHPALLDWLALRFIDSGWDVKAMLRTVVLSATYRQSSVPGAEIREADPDNEWLARGPSYRLPAEMIRDGALAASGRLVRTVGGPSVKPYQPEGIWEELATRNATVYEQDHGDGLYRRTLYTIWKRTSPPPSMISFDAAERFACTVRRQRTATPLQAFVLLNDPQYVEAARLLAERMIREGGTGDRIVLGFRLLTSRPPAASELSALKGLYDAELSRFRQDPAAALALLSTGEHPRDPALDPAETAALAVVASTILNFDEAVVKR